MQFEVPAGMSDGIYQRIAKKRMEEAKAIRPLRDGERYVIGSQEWEGFMWAAKKTNPYEKPQPHDNRGNVT